MVYLLKAKQCHKIGIAPPITIADIALLSVLLKHLLFFTL